MRCTTQLTLLCLVALATVSCMDWDYVERESFTKEGRGLFICNEGNFQYGNATLSYYDPANKRIENEVFIRANGYRLGDIAQSMTLHNGTGWVVVNNSHVLFAIDPVTFRERGRIINLTSPRYIHFLSDHKAYVTQLWDNRIFIIDPSSYRITGHITCPEMSVESGSTEQMVQYGDYLYVSCWSYQNRILKIDTRTDEVVGSLTVGIQPSSLVLDRNGKLWTLTDGGYEGSPYGYEAPALVKIDAATFSIEQLFTLSGADRCSELQITADGSRLYWINDDIWTMEVEATSLPEQPFIAARNTIYYGLTIDPESGELYVADAIDYQQQGIIYRYSAQGVLIDEFYAGIIPGAFCWK